MEQNEELKEQAKAEMEMEETGRGRERSGNWTWLGGVVLILIGLYFLVANYSEFSLGNWWALFILIPAIASFGNAYRIYQQDGQFSRKARNSVIGGLFLTFVASVFLFELDWGKVWPFFIVLAGVGALLNSAFDR